MTLSVAVVGAGISGLVAARSLLVHGVEVRVFEKSRGPGGRTSTRRQSGYAFDHGAQYFTARDERFQREVAVWLQDGVAERWRPRLAVVDQGRIEFRPDDTERYVGYPKMSAIARYLTSDLDPVYSTRVGSVERSGDSWRLTSQQGIDLGAFDAVLIAVPPAQAAPLLQGAPDLAAAAAAVVMRPCWSVMAVFDETLDLSLDAAFIHDSSLSWIARNASKPGRSSEECWVLHGSPEWSSQRLEDEPKQIAPELLDDFFRAVGRPAAPASFLRAHRWRYSIAENALQDGCLWDADSGLGACGDWCSGSRVEGAFVSGLEIADRVFRLSD